MASIPVLFTEKDSVYLNFSNTDCYDIERNALSYNGTSPIIAHPPCRLWSRMRAFSTAPAWERWLAIWSIIYVRKYGGVVEHPAGSLLFKTMNIPQDGSPDQLGGFIISIDQFWFGHQARKRTYLYVNGITKSEIPAFPLRFDAVEYTVSQSKSKMEMPQRFRSSTPLAFAQWLLEIQQLITAKFAAPPLVYLNVHNSNSNE